LVFLIAFLVFFGQKMKKIVKKKPFNDFFGNLVFRWFPAKENPTRKPISILALVGLFGPKNSQRVTKNEENYQFHV